MCNERFLQIIYEIVPQVTFISLLVAIVAVPALLALLNAYGKLKERYDDLVHDDGRLIDMLAERAKREIDDELRKG
jgi:biopolymer transport protein ExbB/TolQ